MESICILTVLYLTDKKSKTSRVTSLTLSTFSTSLTNKTGAYVFQSKHIDCEIVRISLNLTAN